MATSTLSSFPFTQTLHLYGDCLGLAVLLVFVAVPLIVITRELWKGRVR